MSTQVVGQHTTGQNVYLRRYRVSSGGAWQVLSVGSSWGTYSAGSVADYTHAATEEGATGNYVVTLSGNLTNYQTESHLWYLQAGGSPADSDSLVDSYDAIYDGANNQFRANIPPVSGVYGLTMDEVYQKIGGVLFGKSSGNTGTAPYTETFRAIDDSADEVTVVTDSNGNRTSVNLNP